jgi:hypothetical protein
MRRRWLLVGFLVLGMSAASVYEGAPSARGVGSASSSPGSVHPGQCYRSAPARLPANKWSRARRELAPHGAAAIRLCRYAGLNAHPPLTLLRSSLHIGPRLVRKLVHEFDELPPFAPGAVACPMDDGSQIVALLAYPDGHAAKISVALRGCASVTNGDVVRTASGVGTPRKFGPQLVSELKRLTR